MCGSALEMGLRERPRERVKCRLILADLAAVLVGPLGNTSSSAATLPNVSHGVNLPGNTANNTLNGTAGMEFCDGATLGLECYFDIRGGVQ